MRNLSSAAHPPGRWAGSVANQRRNRCTSDSESRVTKRCGAKLSAPSALLAPDSSLCGFLTIRPAVNGGVGIAAGKIVPVPMAKDGSPVVERLHLGERL